MTATFGPATRLGRQENTVGNKGIIGKTITVFFGLVFIYFVLMYPDKIVDLLQLFVDGAHRVATALGGVDTHNPNGT